MRTRRTVGLALAVALAYGGTACSGGAEPTERTPKPNAEQPAKADPGWSTKGVRFASQPVVVAGVLVAYLAVDGGLRLAAYDPKDGKELWRLHSSAAKITPGVAVAVRADGERVYHLAPSEVPKAAYVQAVDVATGEPAWTTDAVTSFTGEVDFCDDSKTELCIASDNFEQIVRTDDGAVDTRPVTGAGRPLGADLYDDGTNISRIVDDTELWQSRPAEMFDGAEVDPDYGWIWWEEDGVLLGSFGSPNAYNWDKRVEFDLAGGLMAGIDPGTGDPLWVEQGDAWCGRLGETDLIGDAGKPFVRCVSTGTLIYQDGELVDTVDVKETLRGYDPMTGATTWSTELTGFSTLQDEERPLVRLGPTEFAALEDDGEPIAVDLETGELREAGLDEVGWCFADNHYPYSESHSEGERAGAEFVRPCRLDGESVDAPTSVDDEVGVVVDGMYAWVDETGLHAVPEP